MPETIRTPLGWVRAADLMRPEVMGRRDTLDLRLKCFDYLTGRHDELRPAASTPERERKVRHALAEAVVMRSVGLKARDADLYAALAERDGTIQDQLAAIDRLLAYVPARAKSLDGARLDEIAMGISALADDQGVRVYLHMSDETDVHTIAAHRINVIADISDGDVAKLEDAVFDYVASVTSPDETPSLFVTVTASDGPAA